MVYKENLIVDVGAHIGVDTEYYLLKGYDVVAIEANPLLASNLKTKFKKEVEDNRLQVMNLGISNKDGMSEFYVNLSNDEWSSFNKQVGTRNNSEFRTETIKCTTLDNVLEKIGIPYYLKIDIEAYDQYCVQALKLFEQKPQYISVEIGSTDLIFQLKNLGYNYFKLVNQAFLRFKSDSFLSPIDNKKIKWNYGLYTSGPFGENIHGKWLDYETILMRFLNRKKGFMRYNPLAKRYWYDIHAKFKD